MRKAPDPGRLLARVPARRVSVGDIEVASGREANHRPLFPWVGKQGIGLVFLVLGLILIEPRGPVSDEEFEAT